VCARACVCVCVFVWGGVLFIAIFLKKLAKDQKSFSTSNPYCIK